MQKVALLITIVFLILYISPVCAQHTPKITSVFNGESNHSVNDCFIQIFTRKDKCVLLCKYRNSTLRTNVPALFFNHVDSIHVYLVPSEKKIILSKCNIIKCYTNYRIRYAYIQTCLKCYDSNKYPQIPSIILFSSEED